MAKRYTRLNFINAPSTATPLNATNLNKIDKGVDDCDNAIEDLYSTKINTADIVTTDTVNNTTKVLGANVGYALGQEIDTVNGKLSLQFITPVLTMQSNYTVSNIFIRKKSGWASVRVQIQVISRSTTRITVATGCPPSESLDVNTWAPAANGQNVEAIGVTVFTNGDLAIRYGADGTIYQFEFSYPCT